MSDKEAVRSEIRQKYEGFAITSRLNGDRSFIVELDKVTDDEYRYKAIYRVEDHTEDTLEGSAIRKNDGWVVEPDHDGVA